MLPVRYVSMILLMWRLISFASVHQMAVISNVAKASIICRRFMWNLLKISQLSSFRAIEWVGWFSKKIISALGDFTLRGIGMIGAQGKLEYPEKHPTTCPANRCHMQKVSRREIWTTNLFILVMTRKCISLSYCGSWVLRNFLYYITTCQHILMSAVKYKPSKIIFSFSDFVSVQGKLSHFCCYIFCCYIF